MRNLLAGVVAYANSLGGPFVFDDLPGIRDNATLTSFVTAFTPPENSGVGGRPFANLTFALNRALGGNAVPGYHAFNLALHVASALLLFAIARRTIAGQRSTVAGAIALVWVVHPLTTASVTYLSQRTELLMAFFLLLTLYAFVRGVQTNTAPALAGSAFACALGMASKETMVAAPLVVLLYDRTFLTGSFRESWRLRRGYYLGLAATWLVVAVLMAGTGLAKRSVGFGLGVSAWDYALAEARAVPLYLELAIWPAPLVFDYGPIYAASRAATVAGVGAVLAMLAGAAWLIRRGSPAGFLAGCFFLLLAPTSSVVPVAEQPMAENRMYLPLAAIVALGILAAHRAMRVRGATLILLAVTALVWLTLIRNRAYADEIRLWTDTVAKRPENARGHFNLGIALLSAGRPEAARAALIAAIAVKPGDPKPHNSLGNVALQLDQPAEAIAHCAEAVRLDPNFAGAWCNLGTARLRTGDATAARVCFERALRLDSSLAEAEQGLGNVHFELGRPAEAILHYQVALRLDPALADACYNAGSACLELGRNDEAIGHFERAAQLRPADAEIRNNYGVALARAKRPADAIAQFEQALRLRPDYAEARSNLEWARSEVRPAR